MPQTINKKNNLKKQKKRKKRLHLKVRKVKNSHKSLLQKNHCKRIQSKKKMKNKPIKNQQPNQSSSQRKRQLRRND